MRVLLDTNVWSHMSDDGSVAAWNEIAELNGLEILLAPSVLLEALRIPPPDVRQRVIKAIAAGPCRRRLDPEAFLEAMEFVHVAKRYRPEWLHQVANPAVVAKHKNFWTKRVWREALTDSDRLHATTTHGAMARERGQLTDSQKAQRRELLATNVSLSPLSGVLTKALPDAPPEVLRGWSGDAVAAWRVSLRDLYWHQLVVIGRRAALTGEDTTYLDWVGAYVDPARCRRSAEDFTVLWLEEAQLEDVPRNWLRWAVNVTQLDNKVTGGNPVDEQHSAYLLDSDVFVTADQTYARVLRRVREEAPFTMADIKHVAAVGELDTAHRVAETLAI